MMYPKYMKMHFKSSIQYKANMAMLSFSSVLVSVAELLGIAILFSNFKEVGGWGVYESVLMFGIITCTFSLAECFGRGFDMFASLIKNGDLDRLLVRPVGMISQIFGSKIELNKLARATFGLVVSIFAISKLNIAWSISKVMVLITSFVCGFTVSLSVMIIGAGIAVFTVENLEFVNIITHGAKEISFYPINVYNKWLTRVFTFVIPMACFNYLPMSYIMGYGNLPKPVYALSPLIGCLFIIPCLLFFVRALRKYQSTGT